MDATGAVEILQPFEWSNAAEILQPLKWPDAAESLQPLKWSDDPEILLPLQWSAKTEILRPLHDHMTLHKLCSPWKGHSQLAHMRIRYHFLANLRFTETHSVVFSTKYEIIIS